MKLAVDTNVLVRALVHDDARQGDIASKVLRNSKVIAVAVPCLCELVWVLRSVYGFHTPEISAAVRSLLASSNVELNRPAVEAGLAMLDAGGDFADGAIAYEGTWLGADTFVSFDKKAVEMIKSQGGSARVL